MCKKKECTYEYVYVYLPLNISIHCGQVARLRTIPLAS